MKSSRSLLALSICSLSFSFAAHADPMPPLACTETRFGQPSATGQLAALSRDEGRATSRATAAKAAGLAAGDTGGSGDGAAVQKSVRVRSAKELEDTLRSTFSGTVIVPRDVSWDMSGRKSIPVRSGVSLVGERGALCSRPTLFTDTRDHDLLRITANDVRIQGIHFRGPAAGHRSPEQPDVDAIVVVVDRAAGLGKRILIRDNELDEWLGSAVDIRSSMRARTPAQYAPTWPRPTRADAELMRVEANFMHHNAREGGGYGVLVGSGAYATVQGNVFDYNRHAVASDGFAYSGYIARFNYILQGGFKQNGYWNQHFDVHGTKDSNRDDHSTGYGGTAGEYYEISSNTIRGKQKYFVVKTRPAFMLRGRPTQGARFDRNVLVHDNLDAAVALKNDKRDGGWSEDRDRFHFEASGNHFGADYSGELAAGDFDGDGRTDVFLANGTAWFVSRAGVEPWQFVQASTRRIRQLGFADMDNDGITDVVWRASNGDLGYFKSAAGAVVRLTTSPVDIKELRFGDFDGDQKTDIFRRRSNGQWMIWYGRTRLWTPAQRSSLPLASLVFGEFDGIRGTDVVGILKDQWAVSSAATAHWARLNARLRPSFDEAVVADFDGDGRSDIAFDDGRQSWSCSPGGSGPLTSLRRGDGQMPFRPLPSMLIGRFDGDAAVEVVAFWDPYGVSPGDLTNHLVIWRGGVRSGFAKLSRASMR